jgi:hypothetical protein
MKKLELQLSPGKVPLPLSLPDPSCVRLPQCPHSNLVPFLHPDLHPWPEWLARQMQAAGPDYRQHDNCFPWVANWTKAQRLMDRQLKTRWPKLLNGIARQLNPIHAQIFRKHPVSYYWSTY